jgi:urate oxidase
MAAALGPNSYGKSAIRLVTVRRHGSRHELRDMTVSTRLEGDFADAHTAGDNAAVLPTDTMKNVVYALASEHTASPPETFAAAIADRLLGSAPRATMATVGVTVHAWDRVRTGDHAHDHAFMRSALPGRLARVTAARDGARYEAGIVRLALLKTSGSAFTGFLRDAWTTLRDTEDRILATEIDATWAYGGGAPVPFDFSWRTVRDALVETFADHDSRSVQHTLHAMGSAVIDRCEHVTEIHLRMPNQHHLPVDLRPFGQENRNEVFVATTEPYGMIEATIRRT